MQPRTASPTDGVVREDALEGASVGRGGAASWAPGASGLPGAHDPCQVMRTVGCREPALCQSRASVAAVFPPVAAAVAAAVHPVGDDDGPANGGGGPAPASCC